jgi:hypothetical protein
LNSEEAFIEFINEPTVLSIPLGILQQALNRNYKNAVIAILKHAKFDKDAIVADPYTIGQILLIQFAEIGFREGIEALFSRGISPNFAINANPEGETPAYETPIHIAARAQSSEVIRLILENTTEPYINQPDRLGMSPLLEVIARPDVQDTIPLFIAKGANLRVRSEAGMTPLSLAILTKKDALVAELEKLGATNVGALRDPHIPPQLARSSSHVGNSSNLLPLEILVEAGGRLCSSATKNLAFAHKLIADIGFEDDQIRIVKGFRKFYSTIELTHELVSVALLGKGHARGFSKVNGQWNLMEDQIGIRVPLLTPNEDFLRIANNNEPLVHEELIDDRIWIYCKKPVVYEPYDSIAIARQYGQTCGPDSIQNAIFLADGLRRQCLERLPALAAGESSLTQMVARRMLRTVSAPPSPPMFSISTYYTLFDDMVKVDTKSSEAALNAYYVLVPSTSDEIFKSLFKWEDHYIASSKAKGAALEVKARTVPELKELTPVQLAQWIWDHRATFDLATLVVRGGRRRSQRTRPNKRKTRRWSKK